MVAKLFLLFLFVFTILLFLQLRNRFMSAKKYTLLSLGDSYTIGEGVSIAENFPSLLVDRLNSCGLMFSMPDILAKTGWTAQNLLEAIKSTELREQYDIVTVLIGVNNQYQKLSIKEYEEVFTVLLKIALRFAGDKADSVFVLTIPDWGKTPYAAGRDSQEISHEISMYNAVNKKITEKYAANFVTATDASEIDEITSDGLHPSSKVYAQWSEILAGKIQQQLL